MSSKAQKTQPLTKQDTIKTFATTPNNVSGLDSITIAGQYVFVEYGNGVDSTGDVPGQRSIIQYDKSGNFVHAYSIEGSVDGLKFNPETGMVWALQNQDGRSSLSLISNCKRPKGAQTVVQGETWLRQVRTWLRTR